MGNNIDEKMIQINTTDRSYVFKFENLNEFRDFLIYFIFIRKSGNNQQLFEPPQVFLDLIRKSQALSDANRNLLLQTRPAQPAPANLRHSELTPSELKKQEKMKQKGHLNTDDEEELQKELEREANRTKEENEAEGEAKRTESEGKKKKGLEKKKEKESKKDNQEKEPNEHERLETDELEREVARLEQEAAEEEARNRQLQVQHSLEKPLKKAPPEQQQQAPQPRLIIPKGRLQIKKTGQFDPNKSPSPDDKPFRTKFVDETPDIVQKNIVADNEKNGKVLEKEAENSPPGQMRIGKRPEGGMKLIQPQVKFSAPVQKLQFSATSSTLNNQEDFNSELGGRDQRPAKPSTATPTLTSTAAVKPTQPTDSPGPQQSDWAISSPTRPPTYAQSTLPRQAQPMASLAKGKKRIDDEEDWD